MSEQLPDSILSDQNPMPVPVQALRFCGTCGSAWEPEWDVCITCAKRSHAAHSHLTLTEEKRAIVNAVSLYAALLAVSIVTQVVILAQEHSLRLEGLAVEELVFSLIIAIWSVASIKAIWPALSKTGPFQWIAAAPLFGVVTFIVANAAVYGMDQLLHMPDYKYLDTFARAGYGLGLGTLFIAVQPAIFEELAFRGIIFDSLRKVTGSTEAIFVSAAMFAILHLSITSFMHLFLMGIVLGFLRSKTGSLYACMILHFTHNFLCLAQEHYGGLIPW